MITAVLATVLSSLSVAVTPPLVVYAASQRSAPSGKGHPHHIAPFSMNDLRRTNAGATINLIAPSSLSYAYTNLITAFQQTAEGSGVTFTTNFGSVAAEESSLRAGQPMDFIQEGSVQAMSGLVSSGNIPSTWSSAPNGGIVASTVIAFVTQAGNPLKITRWSDLIKPGVRIVMANPSTSPVGRWILLEAYVQARQNGMSKDRAMAYVTELVHHITTEQPSDASALSSFTSGSGNVLLTYESTALEAAHQSSSSTYVLPSRNLRIDFPMSIAKSGANVGAARSFAAFLDSAQGQTDWAFLGFRPASASILLRANLRTPSQLITIGSIGGWKRISRIFAAPSTQSASALTTSIANAVAKLRTT